MHKLIQSFIGALCILSASMPVMADAITTQIPDAKPVGQARLVYMLWDVYDATLYAPDGTYDASKPYALSLAYLRDLDGKAIAERSIEEMRKQGAADEMKLAAWFSELKRIFPDVKEGDVITGFFNPNAPTIFHLNGKNLGEVQDPEFGQKFFDIWLSPKTSELKMRLQLIGKK